MNLDLAQIIQIVSGLPKNLSAAISGLSGIRDRTEKDVKSIRLFLEACRAQAAMYAANIYAALQDGRPDDAQRHITAAQNFADMLVDLESAYYGKLLTLAKFQFPKDLWSGKYKDPFNDCREKARAFARVWQLDPQLIDLLG